MQLSFSCGLVRGVLHNLGLTTPSRRRSSKEPQCTSPSQTRTECAGRRSSRRSHRGSRSRWEEQPRLPRSAAPPPLQSTRETASPPNRPPLDSRLRYALYVTQSRERLQRRSAEEEMSAEKANEPSPPPSSRALPSQGLRSRASPSSASSASRRRRCPASCGSSSSRRRSSASQPPSLPSPRAALGLRFLGCPSPLLSLLSFLLPPVAVFLPGLCVDVPVECVVVRVVGRPSLVQRQCSPRPPAVLPLSHDGHCVVHRLHPTLGAVLGQHPQGGAAVEGALVQPSLHVQRQPRRGGGGGGGGEDEAAYDADVVAE